MLCFLLALGLLAPSPVRSQPVGAPENPVTLSLLKKLQREAARDRSLSKSERRQVLDLYHDAIGSVQTQQQLRAKARKYERERVADLRQITSLQAELDRPTRKLELGVAKNAPVEQIEQSLTQERAELKARRQVLVDLGKLSEADTSRRNAIATRIGVLTQNIEGLGDQLRWNVPTEEPAAIQNARRLRLRAQRNVLQQEIVTLRAEQKLLDAGARLMPLLRDRAQRRVAQSERVVKRLEQLALTRKRAEGLQQLALIGKECDQAAQLTPLLKDITGETHALAEMLWGTGGVVISAEGTRRQLSNTQKQIAQIRMIAQLTRRKFEAVKLRGVAAQWWPVMPADLPNPAALRHQIRQRENLIPEVAHQQIVLQEKRVEAGNIESQVSDYVERIKQINPSADAAVVERTVREILTTRRDLLNSLIEQYTRYSDQLFELDSASKQLLGDMDSLDNFLWERVFWTRSVPGSAVPQWSAITGALGWLVANREWGAVWRNAVKNLDWWGLVLIVVLFPLLLFLRPWLRRTLSRIGERAADPERPTFSVTWIALLLTVALTAPLPVILFGFSRLLAPGGASGLGRGVTHALLVLALIAALSEFLREAIRPGGLCVAHFGWAAEATETVHRRLRRLLVVCLPLAFVTLALATDGMRFHGRPYLQTWSNGLGRVCFILVILATTVFVARVFRPAGRVMTAAFENRSETWFGYFRYLWYPLLVLIAIAPALFAARGYYVTGFMLSYQLLRTLAWTLLLALVGNLLVRWRTVQQRKLVRSAAAKSAGKPIPVPTQHPEIIAAEAQVRQLTRFILSLVWIIGAVMIWSQAVPTLRILKHVEIWPKLRITETVSIMGPAPSVNPAASGNKTPTPQPATAGAPASVGALVSGSGQTPAGASLKLPAASAGSHTAMEPLTLADLLLSLLVFIFTIITAKNIPGLLEFTVLRRIPMGPGVRATISTLVRYLITIVGVSIGAGMLGLSWQKIQWLAAALTFGLGFGLQEIFANFVSGLIILLDRPIRVGDVVTIGDAGGWVSKISIRATTVTKWDRSELIVPNKEFITGKLVNWTLSNPLTRIEIKVGVAYDSDVELVRKTLLEVAWNHPAVLKDPKPYVVLMEFGNSTINFELRVYINYDYGRLTLRDEIQRRIIKAFREKKIEIAFPQLDVHINPEVPEEPTGRAQSPSHPTGATPRGLSDAGEN